MSNDRAAVVSAATERPRPRPLLAVGGPDASISTAELDAHLDAVVHHAQQRAARRVLLVPPDQTRLHSRAGAITATLYRRLVALGIEVAVLPALGTHAPMTPQDCRLLFGDDVPFDAVRVHRWRDGVVPLGEISADEVAVLSGGRLRLAVPVETDELLLDGWDLVVSIGQVVPHEVIGMANFTKNVVIGLGGAPTIHRSHFLGAVCDMETIMGRAASPVRSLVDAAFDRYLAPRVEVVWVLTVMEDAPEGVVQRGLFVGSGGTRDSGGAAYRDAAALALACNVDRVDAAFTRVVCRLDPDEFRSTWLGNKAIYRTRMAIADGGELIVLAPGVERFGEDPAIDALIRRHGYHGTDATIAASDRDPELAASLGAAAHLIHGSTEGRFTVTYCTDPASGGLDRAAIEGAGFGWRPLTEELAQLGLDAQTPVLSGPRLDRDGSAFDYISNPALGLWTTAERFA